MSVYAAHEQSKTLDELGCGRMLVLGSDATQQNQLIQQEYSANDRHAKAVLTFKEPQQAMQERAKVGSTGVPSSTAINLIERYRRTFGHEPRSSLLIALIRVRSFSCRKINRCASLEFAPCAGERLFMCVCVPSILDLVLNRHFMSSELSGAGCG